ncbi:carbohydrate esterase family 9 protein [Amanita thiersii Skay4041]|uniref:Carbohydrate esterase family 9 protein n=1 Tax=Amanita thiersii Skay4041 TaxID=703135 RepID=A0A2A9NWJ7_9AGAR|nr:carbohydrate esterase family 9 protein [Amanita thiersii Skay4041]
MGTSAAFKYPSPTSARAYRLQLIAPMTSPNSLVCFTNCLLPQEDGNLIEKDLWIDQRRGIILDAQTTFYLRRERPNTVIDLGGNILSPGYIDLQLNGGYGFDFSVYDGDDEAYKAGMKMVAERIVETGVTSLVPTVITQEKSLYPKLLQLLRPFATPTSATLLGWHAEGPFINISKRGAHAPPYLLSAPEGIKTFEDVYGVSNMTDAEDWTMSGTNQEVGIRIVTAAPEIEGVMGAIAQLTKRGIIFAVGHSVAKSDIATDSVRQGTRLITHLFNAMPQLHHRDPSIIGLLGASPYLYSSFSPIQSSTTTPQRGHSRVGSIAKTTGGSEAIDENVTPPQTPLSRRGGVMAPALSGTVTPVGVNSEGDQLARTMDFERPFYDLIVDGIHCHPNSIRLAYSSFPERCILITDAMKILDPNLRDGVYEWRDGKRYVKEGHKLYLEGTNTLAGSVVTLDTCVRNFTKFTGCTIGQAIKCATYNPAKCLNIEHKKGTLRPGADADLIVLDRHGHVLSTWIKGKKVWETTKQ